MGERTGRYALVIDHGKVTYAEKESSGGEVTVSEVAQPIVRHADGEIGFWSRCSSCKALRWYMGCQYNTMHDRRGHMWDHVVLGEVGISVHRQQR